MLNQDELRLLIKIATLYHEEGIKQDSIAKILNISQSQVSRALNRCVKEGLVKISVIQPPNIFMNLEKTLQKQYDLTQAIIVDVADNASNEQIRRAIGASAAHYMQTALLKGALVGISSWSETIRMMVDNLHPLSTKAAGVIQILGGVGQNGNLQATMLTQRLASMLGCDFYLLPAIGIKRSVEDKKQLMNSIEVYEVVEKFKEISLAIVGIGSIEPSTLLRNSGNYYHEEMTNKLIKRGAVGDICLHYYNAAGEAVLAEDEDPVISMTLAQLKTCPRVIALAGGEDKVPAIRGALNAKLLNTLITDRLTAQSLLSEP